MCVFFKFFFSFHFFVRLFLQKKKNLPKRPYQSSISINCPKKNDFLWKRIRADHMNRLSQINCSSNIHGTRNYMVRQSLGNKKEWKNKIVSSISTYNQCLTTSIRMKRKKTIFRTQFETKTLIKEKKWCRFVVNNCCPFYITYIYRLYSAVGHLSNYA